MTPTRETIAQLASECHNPKLQDESTVLILYDDGELCSTKGGELFGARSRHILRCGVGETFEGFPWEYSGTGACIVSRDDADRILEMIDQVLAAEKIDADQRRRLERYKNIKRMCFDASVGNVLETMDELIDCFAQYVEHGEVKRIPYNVFYSLQGDAEEKEEENVEEEQVDTFSPQNMIEWFKKAAKSYPANLREVREAIITDSSE